jgi:fumarylacetoacetate (FAA) hydrolase
MKLVTYLRDTHVRLGAVRQQSVVDIAAAAAHRGASLPSSMLELLQLGPGAMQAAAEAVERADLEAGYCSPLEAVRLLSPVPRPSSLRDGYAFRQHVQTARKNRGLEMIAEFDEFPVFYFSNHNAVFGPGPVRVRKLQLDRLDFELECAVVIGRRGSNIAAEHADQYVAGYTIMNDLSARELQTREMKLSLGPAKGKDFATVLGPWLVTRDELSPRRLDGPHGERYDLGMTALVNGTQVSRDTLKNMNWTFAQIIERASYGVELMPGDVIGSGTCGTGCFLELNGSGITDNRWLRPGDRIELSIDLLGSLHTVIEAAE